jgi:hypothetical protein
MTAIDCAWPFSTGLRWQLPGQSLVSWFWFAVLFYGQLNKFTMIYKTLFVFFSI